MKLVARVLRHPEGVTGLAIILLLVVAALFAPLVAPGDPLQIVGRPLLTPFDAMHHLLGTDRLGRDVLVGLLYGARTSLAVGLVAALAAVVWGLIIGLVAGFAGGLIDDILMRITDAFQIVPAFLLALAFVSTLGTSLPVIIFAIALGSWADPARLARAQVLSIRESDYVAAARVIGMHPIEIALRQILPGAVSPVLSLSAVVVASAILTESALSFLGLGNPNLATWGTMIAEGRSVLRSAPFLSILPGMALVITVVGVHLLSEGLAKALGFERRFR
ncbi:ABC transporter permease [Oryzifoliimicrobium ureilyticus]|uniref:ABC transporter permease n=1 Tax=Oryzifoliimicrobium ureilyticus TaxID=3113724 RepID=UPI0030764AF9